MNIMPTALSGVVIAETHVRRDDRGSFARLFCSRELAAALGERKIVQINLSQTRQSGTIRGLHFQHAPHAETKLVRCLKGKVWDVAVDLRSGSPTFLRWHAEELTPDNARMMIVPEGCAHGYQTLAPECELLYLHTAEHSREDEDGVAWNDPQLRISWPLPLLQTGGLSDRDQGLPMLAPDFSGVDA
jgi:dTDP-4-dehydrorhamnose 3,5-epimerase